MDYQDINAETIDRWVSEGMPDRDYIRYFDLDRTAYISTDNSPRLPERVVSELKNRFRAHLRVAPIVEVHPVSEIQSINFPPKTRKPIKFIDQR